jgi:hypothetical protein
VKRLLAAILMTSPVLAPALAPAPASAAQAAAPDCSYSSGRTTCVSTSSTRNWEFVDYESGSTDDGTLTATWCQQQSPDAVLNQYETFQTYFLVRSTRTTTTVRRGYYGPVLSVTTADSRRILRYTMPRDPGQEPAPGDALTCSFEAAA